MTIRLVCLGKTDLGLKRTLNEDTHHVSEAQGLCILCDGMGGRDFGEVASSICVSTMNGLFHKEFPEGLRGRRLEEGEQVRQEVEDLFAGWVRRANQEVRKLGSDDEKYKEMGTTLALLYHQEDFVAVAHVGDSRVYRIRDDVIEPLTQDHSLVNEQVKANLISPEEAQKSRLKNILVRAIGPSADVRPDVEVFPALEGDCYLLCSDGLSDLVEEPEMLETVRTGGADLERTLQSLVDQANARGGKDNITVILARLEPSGGPVTSETSSTEL